MDREEAIKEMREKLPWLTEDTKRLVEALIPELRESEDERVRKEIISALKFANDGGIYDKHIAYLEKQKENIEKEYVFRPLVGTDITIAAEQAIRRANEGDRLVLAFNGAYIPVREGCNTNKIVDIYDAFIEKQKEQKPAESPSICIESEHDKGYREGVKYALGKTEQYTIGSTFMGLIPCWVNAPSELQSAHKYHGKNAVIMHENNGGFRCCFIDDKEATTVHLPEDTMFVEGWRKKPEERFEEAREKYQVEWSEEDEKRIKQLIYDTEAIRAGYEKKKEQLGDRFNDALIKDCDEQIRWLKSLRPQPKQNVNNMITPNKKFFQWIYDRLVNVHKENPNVDYMRSFKERIDNSVFDQCHWKPSEHQMNILKAVKEYVGRGSGYWGEGLSSLIEDLEKLM